MDPYATEDLAQWLGVAPARVKVGHYTCAIAESERISQEIEMAEGGRLSDRPTCSLQEWANNLGFQWEDVVAEIRHYGFLQKLVDLGYLAPLLS